MQHQENQIQTVEINRIYPDLHQIKHLNSNYSIETILVVFALLNGLNKLWRSIDKIRKDRKIDPTSLLQTVATIGTIIKAISQLLADSIDRDDEG
jgi:uncharacterized membrane protein